MFLFIIVLSLNISLAAEVRGTIYDLDLNKVENAIIKINSVPEQTFVSKDGSYSFKLNPGMYTLSVNYIEDFRNFTYFEEISIDEDGEFVKDIILFPEITDEQDLIDEDLELIRIDDDVNPWLYVFLIILSMMVFMYFIPRRRVKEINFDEDDPLEKISEFIRKEKRITQKELRKKFPLSEAKVSLVLTELEDKGKIRKIKKGRGNVIIWNK